MTSPDLAYEKELGLLSYVDTEAWESNPDLPAAPLLRRTIAEPTEVWFRGAHNMRPAVAANPYPRFVFPQADLTRRNIKPRNMLSRLLPDNYAHTWIVVHGDHAERFVHDEPEAVERLPAWFYGDDPEALIRLCKSYSNRGWSRIIVGFRPRKQIPDLKERRRFLEWLHRVSSTFPEVRLHLNATTSFSSAFGLNFYAADLDPSAQVQLGMIRLPNGKSINAMTCQRHLKWIHVLGYSATLLKDEQFQRAGFNMRSVLWAAEHWNDPEGLVPLEIRRRDNPLGLPGMPDRAVGRTSKVRKREDRAKISTMFTRPPIDADDYPQMSPDPSEPYAYTEPVSNAPLIPISPRIRDNGDRIVCGACTLATTCRAFREGAVCAMPDSPGSSLAIMFATRDADVIREALGRVLAAQTERYERAARAYRQDDESDVLDIKRSEHLMKMENSLARSGEALVKILDPTFRQSTVPAISGTQIHVYNPRVLVADVIKQLEASGVPRSAIDPSMVVDIAREKGMIDG